MRHMRMYEALGAYGRNYLFCWTYRFTKQIFTRGFWLFCLILPHDPHVFRIVTKVLTENMRLMRMYEGMLFNGFYLPCIGIRKGSRPKYEAVMREYEGHPHIFRRRLA